MHIQENRANLLLNLYPIQIESKSMGMLTLFLDD